MRILSTFTVIFCCLIAFFILNNDNFCYNLKLTLHFHNISLGILDSFIAVIFASVLRELIQSIVTHQFHTISKLFIRFVIQHVSPPYITCLFPLGNKKEHLTDMSYLYYVSYCSVAQSKWSLLAVLMSFN